LRDGFVRNIMAHNYSSPTFILYSGKIPGLPDYQALSESISLRSDFHSILQHSVFGIAPEGNVPETYRFYEIMENGAIPVIYPYTFNAYYRHFLPCEISNHIVVSYDPGHTLSVLNKHLNKVEHRRQGMISVYNAWRDDHQSDLRRRIADVFAGVVVEVQKPLSEINGRWEHKSCFDRHVGSEAGGVTPEEDS
jgi:hypothetical protein